MSTLAFTAATGRVSTGRNSVYLFTDDKFFTAVSLQTHKMISYTWLCQPRSAKSALSIFETRVLPSSISIRSPSRYRISVVPTFSLNLALKSTGSITETCCWCRNCSEWSAELLEMCLTVYLTAITLHQHIALMTAALYVPWNNKFSSESVSARTKRHSTFVGLFGGKMKQEVLYPACCCLVFDRSTAFLQSRSTAAYTDMV